MREILFRAKNKSGDWIYFSNHEEKPRVIMCFGDTVADGLWGGVIDPETVGQFTGMTDGTGEKIFEGDICELEDDDGNTLRFTVVWDKSRFRVVQGDIFYYDLNEDFCDRAVVVGNIHDNTIQNNAT